MRKFNKFLLKSLSLFCLFSSSLDAMLAGGRPNAISGGHNAFAGVVNPANAVFVPSRFDVGLFLVHQKSYLNNRNHNPYFPNGKIDQTYHRKFLITGDAAIHKTFKVNEYDFSLSLATYSTPGVVRLKTKQAIPLIGNTPLLIEDKTQVVSAVFSLKLNQAHSVGISLDYFFLSHERKGFQNAENPLRSVAPRFVTNNGTDHSQGMGLSLGWRWNIDPYLTFGLAFVKKSNVGQYRKYRGYEPRHARNYIPETIGAGFTYIFTKKIAGRLEVLWTHYGSLPNSNNSILPNGELNKNKRGSNKSSGSGLQDATIMNFGVGYKVNQSLSLGAGLSHRIKLPRKSPYIISRSYMRQTIYDLITIGGNYNYHHHDFFLTITHGFPNRQSGLMPKTLGGGKFNSKKCYQSLSLAWGYLY